MSATVLQGDCRVVLSAFPDASFDALVTDPPYGLSKEPDMAEVLRHWLAGDDYKASGGGFMGKSWDSFVPGPATWREVLRVLKPGAYGAVFAGSRTQDLMTVSLRLAGFEIRDSSRYWYEDNEPTTPEEARAAAQTGGGAAWMYGSGFPKSLDVSKAVDKKGGAAKHWEDWGTGLKPAYEPVIIVRKPLVGTVADNVLTHGVGAINIGGCRNGERWPANVLHDGVLDGETFGRYFYCAKASKADRNAGLDDLAQVSAGEVTGRKEGAAGSKSPRAGLTSATYRNTHPTVKPTELMRYLCRQVTPPGGVVLDPFTGSGSTGRGAVLEGLNFVGVEYEEEYAKIARLRIQEALQ